MLDLATFVAAPFCCTLLGEFGAEVIKVEQPDRGDDLRRLGTPVREGLSYWWLVESRNKKSITCNLRTPDGQDLIRRLAGSADVLAENFRPGTMEGWGLGWDALRAANPRLVMVRISAFGQTGPYRERPGFGRIAAAMSGISYLSGALAAFGALVALEHRRQSGEGQVVDVALYEPMLRMLDELVPVYAATGYVRERRGSGTEYVVPHNHYRARDGRWVAIACTNDRMFERLAAAMERPELAAEFPTMAARVARRDELDGLVQAWVGAADAPDVLARLDAAEVPCGPVASVRELFADPQVRARDNILEFPSPLGGLLAMVGIVPRLTASPGRVESAGPVTVGADNEEIYCGRLGLTRDDLRALSHRGVV